MHRVALTFSSPKRIHKILGEVQSSLVFFFRTALPLWGQITWNESYFVPRTGPPLCNQYNKAERKEITPVLGTICFELELTCPQNWTAPLKPVQ